MRSYSRTSRHPEVLAVFGEPRRMATEYSWPSFETRRRGRGAGCGLRFWFAHIGGVSPSRPTLTRLVSNEPSGSFFMKAITLAPGLRSDLSAGTEVTTGVSGETRTFFSPSLYLMFRVCTSLPTTDCSTV